jgi:hypothetical protein
VPYFQGIGYLENIFNVKNFYYNDLTLDIPWF